MGEHFRDNRSLLSRKNGQEDQESVSVKLKKLLAKLKKEVGIKLPTFAKQAEIDESHLRKLLNGDRRWNETLITKAEKALNLHGFTLYTPKTSIHSTPPKTQNFTITLLEQLLEIEKRHEKIRRILAEDQSPVSTERRKSYQKINALLSI